MNIPASSSRSWSVSEESLSRYVRFASENCIQELLSASAAGRFGNASNGWKIVRHDKNGVEISKRDSGPLNAFRSRRILTSVSSEQFIIIANALGAAKMNFSTKKNNGVDIHKSLMQWEGDLVEATHMKKLDENLSIIRLRFGENSKPLFKKREFIVYERHETMSDGTVVVAVASLPKEIAEGLEPTKKLKSNYIRGFLVESGWVLEKLEDSSSMITYVAQLDPSGWLPKYFVNRLNTKLVMIIDSLRKFSHPSPPSLASP